MWADLSVIMISILELFFLMKEQNDRVYFKQLPQNFQGFLFFIFCIWGKNSGL